MRTSPLSLNSVLLDAQSRFQAVIADDAKDVAATNVAEMAFKAAEICIVFCKTPERLIADEGQHLRSALRAMAGVFECLERASSNTTASDASELSASCGECEKAIFSFLEETEPDTWRWTK